MEWMHRIIASPPRASDAAVAAAERALGVRLPPDHVEIARVHQGAMPIPGDIDRDDFDTGVEYLYHFEAEPSPSNIVNAFSIHASRLPDGVVPFAAGIGGDVFCFDYRRDPERPTVAVSLHDNRVSFAELAPSFDAFLALLSES